MPPNDKDITYRPAAARGLQSAALRAMLIHMSKYLSRLVLAALAVLLVASAALAHPHVWVTMKSELVYAADGSITGIRHAWTFDEMFSTFATQGLGEDPAAAKQEASRPEPPRPESPGGGESGWFRRAWNWITGAKPDVPQAQRAPQAASRTAPIKRAITRELLAPLAEVNIASLKEFNFFNHAKANGNKVEFTDPVEYWLDFKDAMLTLNFTLPLKAPLKTQALDLEIFDPGYFVDFSFAEKDAVALANAPADCKVMVARPRETATAQSKTLGEAFFNQLDPSSNVGAQFANRVAVKCP